MAASHSLPQGFTVFQAQLGAPLQFIPALGTQELDDMVNMFIPGNAPLSDKRASISVDFLEYTQLTGQAFKFYVVPGYAAVSPAQSPATASLSASSINASPMASSWDWSSVTGPTRSSVSRKASSTASSRRQAAAPNDFSHLPGMKILTKDGVDVTNAAARGSKTKEQRDHAHLMRVIKACDSCRRKKVRCDPSHKKRPAPAASQTQAQQPVASGRAAKKARISQEPEQTIEVLATATPSTASSSDMMAASSFDTTATFDDELDWDAFLNMPQTGEELDTAAFGDDFWKDMMIPHPADGEEDYNFFHDPQDLLSQTVLDQEEFRTSTSSSSSSSSALAESLSPILSTPSNHHSPSLEATDQWWLKTSESDPSSTISSSSQQSLLSTSPASREEENFFTVAAPMAGSLVSLNVWSPDPGCPPLSSPRPQDIAGDNSGRSGGLLYYAAMAMISVTSNSRGRKKQSESHHNVARGAMSGSLRTSLAAIVPIVAMSFIAATSWIG